jgi:hypothetical protein
MKPYLTHTSPRPGCPCCTSKHFHGIRTKHSGYTGSLRRLKRVGKKCARKLFKREISEQLKDLDFGFDPRREAWENSYSF